MRVLVACEFTGTVREAFAARGHDAWSSDLRPSERPGQHYQGDVRDILSEGWDLMIAHPPCQYLTYAAMGVWNQLGRAELREAAMTFFMEMVNAPIPRICVENPRGLPCQAYRAPDQVIHPYMFGDRQLKRTCIWLKGLPVLWWWDKPGSLFEMTATEYPESLYTHERKPSKHYKGGEVKKRYFVDVGAKDPYDRSRTFPAIAAAMANQWG